MVNIPEIEIFNNEGYYVNFGNIDVRAESYRLGFDKESCIWTIFIRLSPKEVNIPDGCKSTADY
jgi:hypothetical protein